MGREGEGRVRSEKGSDWAGVNEESKGGVKEVKGK